MRYKESCVGSDFYNKVQQHWLYLQMRNTALKGGTQASFAMDILYDLVIKDISLKDAWFNGAILHNCTFKCIDFSNCNFDRANIVKCNFTQCTLGKSSFINSLILGCTFYNMNMADITVDNAECNGNLFNSCDLGRKGVYKTLCGL